MKKIKKIEPVKIIRNTAEQFYPGTFYLAGQGVSTYDLMDSITADVTKVNLIAIGAVFLVLLTDRYMEFRKIMRKKEAVKSTIANVTV